MGISETYRLNKAILSIYPEDSKPRMPIMIPSGAVVTITDGPLDGLRMVDVIWETKTVMMFTVDLRDRATLIRKRSSLEIVETSASTPRCRPSARVIAARLIPG